MRLSYLAFICGLSFSSMCFSQTINTCSSSESPTCTVNANYRAEYIGLNSSSVSRTQNKLIIDATFEAGYYSTFHPTVFITQENDEIVISCIMMNDSAGGDPSLTEVTARLSTTQPVGSHVPVFVLEGALARPTKRLVGYF